MHKLHVIVSTVIFAAFGLCGCKTTGDRPPAGGPTRNEMKEAIANEPVGAYYVGRRYYKKDYKFWGYVRKSGMQWNTAQLVLLNENTKFAPDREQARIGSDNNYEYKLTGDFTGERVYEPASNNFYPEFRLRGYELLTATPAPIFREAGATDPDRRIIPTPY